jgi:hypothetical protein
MAKRTSKSLDLSEPILVKRFGSKRIYEKTELLDEWLMATGE